MLEFGPLVAFFAVTMLVDIYAGTAVFMASLVCSAAITWARERRLPVTPAVSAVLALIFGGLTIALEEPWFIKMRPTILNLLFAVALFLGLVRGKYLLRLALGGSLEFDSEAAWRKLTWRTIAYLGLLALFNELVWRTQSTELWATFKVFAVMPLNGLFAAAQVPFVRRHRLVPGAPAQQ